MMGMEDTIMVKRNLNDFEKSYIAKNKDWHIQLES
jgi:hypothetical protein